jgi:glycosyltransferase involved in cell wall biosynthesis
VLLVAFHYPPCSTSSGVQRTIALATHLHEHGWRPVVLTAHEAAYERINAQQLADVPADVPVIRTHALDAARHLAIRGRYWSRLALPDRWMSWRLTAVPRGLQIVRRHHIDAIWSTYPIATAHLIAASLARRCDLPWVADFRDPMVETVTATGEVFPAAPALRQSRLRVEAQAVKSASSLVFCTTAARRIVHDRYPDLNEDRTHVISNGYHERAFRDAEVLPCPARTAGRRVLLHSGTVYPGTDRDPTALFRALKILSHRGLVSPANLELRLRDPSNEDYFRRLGTELGVLPLISILPPLPYREALAEMLAADGLLLLQGYTSNPAVPAKLYEYLRAGRPILALVHPDGETATTLRSVGIRTTAPLTDVDEIAALLSRWISGPESLEGARAEPERVAAYSREHLVGCLANLLDRVVERRVVPGF